MESKKTTQDTDKWYNDNLKILLERYKSLLRERTDFKIYEFPNEVESNPEIIKTLFQIFEMLGANFPSIPEANILKTSIAQDFIKWMKKERPDVLQGMLNLCSNPDENRENNKEEYERLRKQGNQFYADKKYQRAILMYEEALKINCLSKNQKCILHSNIANTFYELYQDNHNLENLNESFKNAKLAIHFDPKWVKAYFRLAKISQIKSLDQEALEFYEKCNELMPGVSEVIDEISKLKLKIFDKNRNSNLFEHPKTEDEEIIKIMYDLKISTGQDFSDKEINEVILNCSQQIPGYDFVVLGHRYRDGNKNTKIDYGLAAKYYSKAMKANNPEGIYNLALLYSQGIGVKLDFKMSMKLLEIAAKCEPTISVMGFKMNSVGVAEAQHSLGIRYIEGIYVQKDIEKGIAYFNEALSNGSGHSANNLGIYYMDGEYVKKDLNKAEKLLLYAYSKKIPQAVSNLVDLYLIKKDKQSVLKWHKKALEEKCLFSMTRDNEIMNLINEF